MRIPAGILFLVVLMSFGVARPAEAQTPDSLLQGIREAYQQLNYELAEQRAMQALAFYDRFSNAQLVEIHTTLGLVNYAQNELDAARRQFLNALALRPDLRLDPLLVSPKILEFFEQIKREAQAQPMQVQFPPMPSIRYVQLVDVQTAAALRSLVLPGWGQLYKRQPGKGWALVGLWGATATGAIVSGVERDRAHDRLERAQDPQDLEEAQDRYDRWRRVQRNFLIGAAGVWLYSYLDALLDRRPLPAPFETPTAEGMSLSAGPDVGGLVVRYRVTF